MRSSGMTGSASKESIPNGRPGYSPGPGLPGGPPPAGGPPRPAPPAAARQRQPAGPAV